MRPPRTGLSLLTAAVLGMASAPAHGFVRKKTDAGIPEYWQVSCVPLTIYTYGFSDMTRDQVAKSVGAAAHTWSPSEVTCPDGVSHPFLEIVTSVANDGAKPPLPAYDGHNTFFFYSAAVPPPPDSPFAVASDIIALTSVFARADGHIVDADVQINNLDRHWTNRDPGFVPPGNGQIDEAYDLQNAVTHELGHLQGLGHSSWNPFSDLGQPIDDMDSGVPYCDSAVGSAVAQTVMFANILGSAELTKRTLSPDDIRAVCSIYPLAADPNSCDAQAPADGCGCSAGGVGPGSAALVLLFIVAGTAAARRRRRR